MGTTVPSPPSMPYQMKAIANNSFLYTNKYILTTQRYKNRSQPLNNPIVNLKRSQIKTERTFILSVTSRRAEKRLVGLLAIANVVRYEGHFSILRLTNGGQLGGGAVAPCPHARAAHDNITTLHVVLKSGSEAGKQSNLVQEVGISEITM